MITTENSTIFLDLNTTILGNFNLTIIGYNPNNTVNATVNDIIYYTIKFDCLYNDKVLNHPLDYGLNINDSSLTITNYSSTIEGYTRLDLIFMVEKDRSPF